jgi:hypothetical protein
VQIAFADDWLMYVDYNQDEVDVENHNMGVLNDVQTNYDTEFEDDLMFSVVEIWISTCSTCDPWTNSTNAGTLLDDFTDWGPSGFDNTHDVADLWTDRDFNGATIGISWLEAVCTPFRYLTTQDYSTGGGQLRTSLHMNLDATAMIASCRFTDDHGARIGCHKRMVYVYRSDQLYQWY